MPVHQIEVAYRIVTPLFCSGSDPDKAEVRLPSFKGVLRWWWRALAWARYRGNLDQIHDAEAALFGSAGGGQSRVAMRLGKAKPPGALPSKELLRLPDRRVVGEGARYLGYGVMEAFGSAKKGVAAGELTRACLPAPFDLELELRARDLDESALALLLDALRAVGLLGALGAKSRKGYGSVVLRSMAVGGQSCWEPPGSIDKLKQAIGALFSKPTPSGLPLYTALSSRTRIVLVPGTGRNHPLELLDLVGCEVMRYRSWGHNGKVLGKNSERNFRDDHDLMKARPDERRTHPRRIVFGLPHNYGPRKEEQVGPADRRIDRRASPLLVHIHECGEAPVAVLSFLPAMFLPDGDRAKIDVGGRRPVTIAPDPELWQPIDDLLTRFLDPRRFGQALELRP